MTLLLFFCLFGEAGEKRLYFSCELHEYIGLLPYDNENVIHEAHKFMYPIYLDRNFQFIQISYHNLFSGHFSQYTYFRLVKNYFFFACDGRPMPQLRYSCASQSGLEWASEWSREASRVKRGSETDRWTVLAGGDKHRKGNSFQILGIMISKETAHFVPFSGKVIDGNISCKQNNLPSF